MVEGSLGGMQFRISAIFLPCFRKSADINWLFPLFISVMRKIFLLHIKHDRNHFLSILHVTDQTRAVAIIMGDYFARKFCCCCCYCGCCLQIFVICIFSFVLVPLSKCYAIFCRNEHQICDFLATNINFAEISAFRKNATNIRNPQK